jgi:hypothetical protein
MQFPVRSSGTHTNNFRPWSEEDEAKLVEMREAGQRVAVIAKELGRTQASCDARWYH